MTQLPLIDIFSPLPPCSTDVANHTAGVLPALSRMARVRIWTAQNGAVDLQAPGVELCRFDPGKLPIPMLNQADATFFNLGNNAAFHRDIHAVARSIPGIVILHDTRLQHFFAAYGEHQGPERQYYLDLLERAHGADTRALAEAHIAGRGSFDELVNRAPMTLSALEGSLGAILHNRAECAALQSRTQIPLYYLPLSFRFGPPPQRTRKPAPNEPSRLVMFGFIGANRRLLPILQALAGMPDRAQYRLDIYGPIEPALEAEVDAIIASAGLAEQVTRHGFVPERDLSRALADADLALNLRWPSMGEASGSQLRIWSAQLPALVTRVGWYAELPEDAVFMIDPAHERDGIVHHLRALRRDPTRYVLAGETGRKILEAQHSPEHYAQGLVAVARDRASQHARRTGTMLAETCASALLELGPADLARPLGGEIARRIVELTDKRPATTRIPQPAFLL